MSSHSASSAGISKIAIVGAAGKVGSAVAYNLVLNPLASEIVLLDTQTDVLHAQAQDLNDAIFQCDNTSTRVKVAKCDQEAGQCDIVVITAGGSLKKGESRVDLAVRNVNILSDVVEKIKPVRRDMVVVILANPIDIITTIAQKLLELPKNQVFGTGTLLDTGRLKGAIAERTGLAPSSIDAYVLGEHGNSQVVAWSGASVGGVPLDNFVESGQINKEQIAKITRHKAGAIINGKGETSYGIGAVAASVCKSILFDQRVVKPVSHWQEDLGVCLSTPVVLGRGGILKSLPVSLDEDERKGLEDSAAKMRELLHNTINQNGRDPQNKVMSKL